jgi:hypothetical protein
VLTHSLTHTHCPSYTLRLNPTVTVTVAAATAVTWNLNRDAGVTTDRCFSKDLVHIICRRDFPLQKAR